MSKWLAVVSYLSRVPHFCWWQLIKNQGENNKKRTPTIWRWKVKPHPSLTVPLHNKSMNLINSDKNWLIREYIKVWEYMFKYVSTQNYFSIVWNYDVIPPNSKTVFYLTLIFPFGLSSRNISVLGRENSFFPLKPVIRCLCLSRLTKFDLKQTLEKYDKEYISLKNWGFLFLTPHSSLPT